MVDVEAPRSSRKSWPPCRPLASRRRIAAVLERWRPSSTTDAAARCSWLWRAGRRVGAHEASNRLHYFAASSREPASERWIPDAPCRWIAAPSAGPRSRSPVLSGIAQRPWRERRGPRPGLGLARGRARVWARRPGVARRGWSLDLDQVVVLRGDEQALPEQQRERPTRSPDPPAPAATAGSSARGPWPSSG